MTKIFIILQLVTVHISIHKANGGLSSSRNADIDAAKGAYIGFVDSDDYIHPQMYAKFCAAIKASSADMAVCNYMWINEDEFTTHHYFAQCSKVAFVSDVLYYDIQREGSKAAISG